MTRKRASLANARRHAERHQKRAGAVSVPLAHPVGEASAMLVLCAVGIAFSLGAALQMSNGMMSDAAMFWLNWAMAAWAAGMVAIPLIARSPAPRKAERVVHNVLVLTTWLGLCYWLYLWQLRNPGKYAALDATAWSGLRVCLAAATALGVVGVGFGAKNPESRWLTRLVVPAFLALYVGMGVWLVHASPNPHIDVVVLHREALAALLRGENPYGITFPNIYAPDVSNYPAGTVVDGRVMFGYVYPPINLLMALPGHLLGDYRYSLLALNVGTVLLLWCLGRGLEVAIAAALLLLSPRVLFTLEQGWTEPVTLFLFAMVVFTALRRPRFLPYVLGLLLVSKQYAFTMLGVLWLLREIPWWGIAARDFWLRVVGAAAATVLPFFLWSPKAFWHSLVETLLANTIRSDGLTYLVWWTESHGENGLGWLGFATGLGTAAACARLLPRRAWAFAWGTAASLLMFFAFNRWAYCNYYFLVIGTCAVAVASAHPRGGQRTAK